MAGVDEQDRLDLDGHERRPRSDAGDQAARTLRLLDLVAPAPRPFDVRLWDGTVLSGALKPRGVEPGAEADGTEEVGTEEDGTEEDGTEGGPEVVGHDRSRPTLVLNDPHALGRALTPPFDLSAGEAFVRGEIDIEGNVETLLDAFDALMDDGRRASLLDRVRAMGDVAVLRRQAARSKAAGAARLAGPRHSQERDAHAVRHHYDLPVDFYRLWLDEHLTYSCAYFTDGAQTLDEAQEAKLEHVCRKLRLRSGHTLLDIGCGWGALLRWAAQRHGANAFGVTLAENQAAEANARLAEAGLDGRASALVRDYRELDGTFDRVASIGMSEHVGRAGLERYFRSAWDRLAPGGLMLNHAISRGPRGTPPDRASREQTFVHRYVFPDGEIVDLAETIHAAEAVGFEVRDVENLREHYAITLRRWVARLEASWSDAVDIAGEERARTWRLFMAGAAHQFAHGRLAVHQVLLGRPDADGRVEVPPTRADLYA